ncbi:serine/threonine protein phosphatase [Arthrobacter gengyunqii]|uniref:Serine/threonine protein phosphatase n=1 Tax=Arthrobacter gengyunqii TaxID=2886940 RepID=A0A9X1S619_9MICC|nr:serine/threonine protein phosphatase [Arthrobacter gengyunqii]MCC3270070.1 serine/threonine protein phosphatase [Arthrobacter gengyunqii]UOY95016.1 serine/threonine protein phosphatase [Arthrobacter gengyunqii]
MPQQLPQGNTFDHRRSSDGEHVGYIHMTDDGAFIPFDLLHRQRAEALELEEAENLLDDLGLAMFVEDWWLDLDGEQVPVLIREVRRDRVSVAFTASGAIAKAADMTTSIDILLPTDRLHQAKGMEA